MEHMHPRSTLALMSALFCAQATLTANTSYDLNFGAYTNESLNYTGNDYVSGLWTEVTGGGNDSTQNIDCMVDMITTAHTCGNPGPSSAVDVPISGTPAGAAATGASSYLEVDGDPMWGAAVYTDLDAANSDALMVGDEYTLSFYQASNEEGGNPATPYNDSWQVYMTSGTGAGTYICPITVCTSGAYTNSNLAFTSLPMANSGETTTAWQLQTYTFIATSANEVLEFVTQAVVQNGTEHTAGNFDPPFLDLASVNLTETPEPGTWLLTVLGAGIVFAATKLRRRPSAGRASAAFKRVQEG
jgi:hypothetical protein